MRSWFVAAPAVGLLAVLLLPGCSGLEPVDPYQPITDPAQLYMRLRIDHRAVNLSTVAPYDTLQLAATPLNGAGEPLTGLPAPVFRSSDTTRVWVSPDGLLRARRAATNVRIIAELAVEGNVRHVDTVLVNVRASAPPPLPATLAIDPVPPDSAVWTLVPYWSLIGHSLLSSAGVSPWPEQRLNLRVLDQLGRPITGLAIEYESLDQTVATVGRSDGRVTTVGPGQVPVVARTTVYGVALADTAVFTVTLPVVNGFGFEGDSGEVPKASATEVVVRQNGYVFWANGSADSLDVRFDDPTNVAAIPQLCAVFGGGFCQAGDIGLIGPVDASGNPTVFVRGRRFPVPGTYRFRELRTGITGSVVVVAD